MRAEGAPVCPLCRRPIPAGVRHHLTPKLKGGKGGPTVLLHAVCHLTIHKELSGAELARDCASVEALRAHPGIARFVTWVQKRPPEWRGRVR